MKNVSSSNGNEKYPKLRFPEFTDVWLSEKFGNLFIEHQEKTSDRLSTPLYSLTIEEGVTQKTERYEREHLITKKNEFYKIVPPKAFVYNPMNLRFGALAPNLEDFPICVSGYYNVFSLKNEETIGFWQNYLISNKMLQHYFSIATGSLIEKLRVHYSQFVEIVKPLPSTEEQIKISDFLNKIDFKIRKQKELIDALKKYKRGLSKKLFNEVHNDTTCVVKQFSEVFELLQNNTFSRECLTNATTEILNIHYGDILVKYGSVVDLDIDVVPFINNETDTSKFKSSSYLQDGDVIFADTAEDYTVGKMCEIINVSNRKILSGLHTMPYRPTITFAPMYLGHYLNSAAFRTQILPMIQGAKVSSISKGEIKKTIVYIPSIDCQRKIVSILNTLDKRIKKAEVVHNELKQMKQGLLQNLFI